MSGECEICGNHALECNCHEEVVKKYMNHDEKSESCLRKLLKRDFYSPMELVRMGLFGGRSFLHRLFHQGTIDGYWISERRLVLLKDSIIKYIMSQQ